MLVWTARGPVAVDAHLSFSLSLCRSFSLFFSLSLSHSLFFSFSLSLSFFLSLSCSLSLCLSFSLSLSLSFSRLLFFSPSFLFVLFFFSFSPLPFCSIALFLCSLSLCPFVSLPLCLVVFLCVLFCVRASFCVFLSSLETRLPERNDHLCQRSARSVYQNAYFSSRDAFRLACFACGKTRSCKKHRSDMSRRPVEYLAVWLFSFDQALTAEDYATCHGDSVSRESAWEMVKQMPGKY